MMYQITNLIAVWSKEMELKELKIMFEAGGLKSVVVAPAPMIDGYMLIVKDKNNKDHIMTSQRSDEHEPRIFKSIDAAVGNASKIGFRSMQVEL
jgi:hypothetical protein